MAWSPLVGAVGGGAEIGAGGFDAYVRQAVAGGRLVVQPRMGFSRIGAMRAGLLAVKAAVQAEPRIGTLTIDAYTRVGQVERATEAVDRGLDLNGFPIISHGRAATDRMLEGLRDGGFPVQVRHGSAFPQAIFAAAAASGFDAIEGGPVSYNLPYSRAPLGETVVAWREAVRFWAEHGQRLGIPVHLETFAGCMLGQLCPPSLLVALAILEGLFFVEHGIESISLSLTQGTNDSQDVGALLALSALAKLYFPSCGWHIVYYTFMGVFPQSIAGAEEMIRSSARIAVQGGAHRLIVKTVAEARGIATVEENVSALHCARLAADQAADRPDAPDPEALRWAGIVTGEAVRLIEATRRLHAEIGPALVDGFARGLLDVPYCSHPNNRNAARAAIEPGSNAMIWGTPGLMPIELPAGAGAVTALDSKQFHAMLDLNRDRYDRTAELASQEGGNL